MLFSDATIRTLCDERLVLYPMIQPFYEELLQPCSYDVRLGSGISHLERDPDSFDSPHILAYDKDLVGLYWETDYVNEYTLRPGELILGTTQETVYIPDNVGARFEGKSSLGRMGLTTHVTAGFIDAGFHGEITLEIKNETEYPITVKRGMRIGQLCFFGMDRAAERPYGSEGLGSHYQGQTGPTAVR